MKHRKERQIKLGTFPPGDNAWTVLALIVTLAGAILFIATLVFFVMGPR